MCRLEAGVDLFRKEGTIGYPKSKDFYIMLLQHITVYILYTIYLLLISIFTMIVNYSVAISIIISSSFGTIVAIAWEILSSFSPG